MATTIRIFGRTTAADPVTEIATYPATPRGALAAWRKLEEERRDLANFSRGARPVGAVLGAEIDGRNITDDLEASFRFLVPGEPMLKGRTFAFLGE